MEQRQEIIFEKPPKKINLWVVITALVLVLFAAGLVFLFGVNRFYVTIELAGDAQTQLEYGEVWEEPGAAAMIRGTVILKEGFAPKDLQVTITGQVEEELGQYQLHYSASYKRLTGQCIRTVQVVDTQPPEIALVADPYLDMIDGTKYKEEGYKATDNHDGDLTDQVQRQEIYGKVLYTVTDSSGNRTTVERIVSHYDALAPTILLQGAKTIILQIGQPYEEPGYIALDNVDGEITEQVIIEGKVDVFRPGIYSLQYKVSDSHGNWSMALRTVEVISG